MLLGRGVRYGAYGSNERSGYVREHGKRLMLGSSGNTDTDRSA